MMSSHDHTLRSLQAQLANLEDDKLGYEDELEYALQAPYGTTSDTLEAVKDNEEMLEDVNDEISFVKASIENLQEG